MEGVVTLLIQLLVQELISQGFDVITNILPEGDDGTGGGTVIQWGSDEDGDGDPDDPFDIFIPNSESQTVVEKSIVIVSPDGTITIYDENGNLTEQDCDTAYSLWLSENAALEKDFENYSVSEGLLFLIFICVGFGMLSKIFKRRSY